MNKDLLEIGKELITQDNRCTCHPVFQIVSREGSVIECFLTNKAAQEHMKNQAHNLEDAYVYAASGWRNLEWIKVREALIAMAEK